MPDSRGPAPDPSLLAPSSSRSAGAAPRKPSSDAVVCERCATEMFRMHAVWRCPSCGFKTDCCGW